MALIEIAIYAFLFFLPSIVTYYRNPEEFWLALIINILLGFIAVGWFWAWYYALKDPVPPPSWKDDNSTG